jgi:RNA polymerase sigma factor FliA
LSRRVRRRVREVELAKGELAQRLGRDPTEEEVARQLSVGLTEYRGFLKRCWHAQVGSLEAHLECDGGLHGLVADSRAADRAAAQRVLSCERASSRQ